MPVLGFVGLSGKRWFPPVPLPLFLLWPVVFLVSVTALLLSRARPVEAEMMRTGVRAFRELRGLRVDVDAAELAAFFLDGQHEAVAHVDPERRAAAGQRRDHTDLDGFGRCSRAENYTAE